MSEKNRDAKGRWRSVTIAFRVTPEEKTEIQRLASLEGVPVSQYILSKIL